MRKRILSIFAMGVALGLAVPASAAEQKAGVPHASHRPESLTNMLSLRLRSIELQVDILRDRDLIGREEAQDLRVEAHRLEQRLYRSSGRETRDVELAVDRLQEQLRVVADDMPMSGYASRRRDLGRFDDGDRYTRDSERYYDRDDYQRADPRGDPFAIWEERDEREPH